MLYMKTKQDIDENQDETNSDSNTAKPDGIHVKQKEKRY